MRRRRDVDAAPSYLRRGWRPLSAWVVFPTIVLPVARVGHLIAPELLSRDDPTRPVTLIHRWGCAGGRDLEALLEPWLG
jgi:hypothetical protein